MEHQVESKRLYLTVFFSLMVLTALTVGVSFIDLGWANTPVALAIACAKASLVVMFFMHVRHAQPLTKTTILSGLIFLMILLILTMGDYATRSWMPLPTPW